MKILVHYTNVQSAFQLISTSINSLIYKQAGFSPHAVLESL